MIKKIAFIFLVIIIVAIITIFGRKDLTLTKSYIKQKYSLPNSHFLQWKGAEIHYTESGKGIPVLMIHGYGGSNYDFVGVDSLLNDKYRVIRIDLPGFGLSDFPNQTHSPDYIQLYNEYFTFLLDTLKIDSLYVLGNSLGGLMAWNLAINHPQKVKKLVLFNSAGYNMEETLKTANARIFKNSFVKLLAKKGLPKFFTKTGISRVFFDPQLMTEDRISRVNELWNREGNLTHIMQMASSDKFLDTAGIKTITCPTLIFWGKEDKIVLPKNAYSFQRDIVNSKLVMLDSCGHVPMLEKLPQVNNELNIFFK
jgi:pimeloyl-ACP methyl ester carboxylesterase